MQTPPAETVCIAGVGYAVPAGIQANSEILKLFPHRTEDEIVRLTGVRERRRATEDESATSLAAMGLAMMVAALAQTETQVAIYGTLLVLVLAGLSGGLMGDRSLMPETMRQLSLVTPHAWALDAYRQLLTTPQPNLHTVAQSCAALGGFGVVFLALAWCFLKLET